LTVLGCQTGRIIMTKKKVTEVTESVTETVVETPTVKPTYNIDELAQHLCCQGQFGHILDWLTKLSNTEVKTLRDQLRSRTGNNHMPWLLEHKFRRHLGEE
jgi:hypothetical protein